MGIKPFKQIPKDLREWSRFFDEVDVVPTSSVTDVAPDAVGNSQLQANAVGTTNIVNDAVTFAKMQNVATGVLLGRSTAGTGDVETIAQSTFLLSANVLNGSTTYDPPNLADAAGTTTTVTVTGAVLGDFALASFSLDLQGITLSAYVSAADTVSVRFQNESGGALDLASGTLKARVWK